MSERLDNLIPIHVSLAQHQLAAWDVPPPSARQGLGVHLRADVKIPMEDGTLLSADVYLPEEPGRYPVILQFSSYNYELDTAAAPTATNEIGSPALFVPRGYAMVVVSARAIGKSDGALQLWLGKELVDDLERCIAWAAAQAWCNGDVAMFGTSYFGMVQPLVAVRRPPALKALFCNEICTSYPRHLFRYGGQPNLDFLTLWAGANFRPSSMKRHVPPVVRAALSWLLAHKGTFELVRPHIDAIQASFKQERGVDGKALAWITALIAGEERALAFPEGPSRELANIHIPFVVVQNRGIVGLHQFGAYDLFENAGTPRDRKWLIVGPAEYELPVSAWQLEALAFFDHVLLGAANGYDAAPRVRYFRDGSEAWGRADDFPPPSSTTLALYPASEGALSDAAPAGDESASWLALPRGYAVLPEIPSVIPEHIAFSFTAPRVLEIFGPVTLSLSFSCNEIDSFVAARLDRVSADGATRAPLAFGYLRPSVRRVIEGEGSAAEIALDPDAREPLVPGQRVRLRFSMTPASASLAPGDRIELRLASRSEQIRLGAAEGFILPDAPVPFFSKNQIHFGADTHVALTLR